MSWKYIEIPLYVENKHSLRRNKKSLVVQIIKNFPAIQETWVQFLSVEDPLEEGMAIQPSILAWRIPWTEEPSGYRPWRHKELDMTETT